MEVQGDLVSGLIVGITRVTKWVIGVIHYLLSPPDCPNRMAHVEASQKQGPSLGNHMARNRFMFFVVDT